jgi:succinoglycan biosynthesis protein ExoU
MPFSAPSVAIIIAAYNAGGTIGRAVRSALAEPETAEVIVVDDDSTDDTTAQAAAADDGSGRLRLVSLTRNEGPAAARNLAIEQSAAPWVAVLDADDFFLPGRLAGLLRFSDKAALIADDMWRVAENDIDGPRTLFLGLPAPYERTVSFADFVVGNVTDPRNRRGELGFIKPLIRRAFIDAHHLRYQEHMRLGEDFEFYARALALGALLLLVPAQGYVSVVRAGSLSHCHTIADLRHLRNCATGLGRLQALYFGKDRRALTRWARSIDCRLQWRLLIEAVKARRWKAAIATFLQPLPVPAFLLRRLFEQLILRVGRKRLKPLAALPFQSGCGRGDRS